MTPLENSCLESFRSMYSVLKKTIVSEARGAGLVVEHEVSRHPEWIELASSSVCHMCHIWSHGGIPEGSLEVVRA